LLQIIGNLPALGVQFPFYLKECPMKKLLAVAALLTAGCLVLWVQGSPRPIDPQKDDGKIPVKGGDAKSGDEKALLEAVYAYKEAFNRGDAKAVGDFFGEHAELVDDKGDVIEGRDAIQKEFAKFFDKNPGAKVDVAIDWCRWLTNESIIQHGAAKVTRKDGAAVYSTYTAVYVKRDGKWLISMVREIPAAVEGTSTQESNLEALAWLVGDWRDEDADTLIEISCDWGKNKTFLNRKFTVYAVDRDKGPQGPGPGTKGPASFKVMLECTEIIGWDPSRGILRSWVFDSHGGFAEGIWLHKGDRWYVKAHGVTSDGKKSSALHILTPTAADQYKWRSVSRTLSGQIQPDIAEVVVRRVSTGPNK
jgi:uncharacterized protein (TIGR02246 family)